MTTKIEDIQSQYIRELRSLLPDLQTWWEAIVAARGEDGAWERWPTGISGHPRVLAVFRKYFLEIEALNAAKTFPPDAPEPQEEDKWGQEDDEEDVEFELPAEWLIYNISDEAPDLEDLVGGICFVPIGEDLDEEVA